MKLNFRYRLFLYMATLFTVFVFGIGVFEHSREKAIKTEGLEEKLDVYVGFPKLRPDKVRVNKALVC